MCLTARLLSQGLADARRGDRMRLFYAVVLGRFLAALPARAEVDIQEVTSPGWHHRLGW